MKKILIVGAGLAGSVIAEQLSKTAKFKIDIIDERNHIGGNCYTERDAGSGVMVHTYGPHIFNTDKIEIWNYVNQFAEMVPFVNRVKSIYNEEVYSMPINLHTINQFFKKAMNPSEAKEYIESLGDQSIVDPQNFEEQAMKFIGEDLYKAFFYGYTKKQWGCEPTSLPASILKRLPVRFSYNDNYYSNEYQGIPKDGYTEIFEKMLDHPNIKLELETKYTPSVSDERYDHIFYTGPIDAFFEYKYGRLSYRTVYFEENRVKGDFQGNAVINYANSEIPYTRIHEHKHFTPWEEHEESVYFKEYSKETTEGDLPYYPKRLPLDIRILNQYQAEANKLSQFTFVGRLATYRYLDMQHVIEEALCIAKKHIA